MSRSTRLLQLMQLLRTLPSPVRGHDLAEALEISLRTLYRDIEALRASGAIIDGEAGYGYMLEEDPALPPMMFSRDEMEALVLGLREVNEIADPVLAAAARDALSKLRACLPPRMRQELESAVLHVKHFNDKEHLQIDAGTVRKAARDETIAVISYLDLNSNRTTRPVKPLSIVYMDNNSVLLAWCGMRQAFRIFRMDRIEAITLTDQSFRPHRAALLRDCLAEIAHERG